MDTPSIAEDGPPPQRALVLSGGLALGAFEAGAYAALEEAGEPPPGIVVGASAGAVNAAIIAGNPPGARAAPLRRFWDLMATDPTRPPHSCSARRRRPEPGAPSTTRRARCRRCCSAIPGCSACA